MVNIINKRLRKKLYTELGYQYDSLDLLFDDILSKNKRRNRLIHSLLVKDGKIIVSRIKHPFTKKELESIIKKSFTDEDWETRYDFKLINDNTETIKDILDIDLSEFNYKYMDIDKVDRLEVINKMIADDFNRPVKIVITSNSEVWVDNTNILLSLILKADKPLTLKEIPFYVIDFRNNTIDIVSYNDSVIEVDYAMERAIDSAIKLEEDILLDPDRVSLKIKDIITELFDNKTTI